MSIPVAKVASGAPTADLFIQGSYTNSIGNQQGAAVIINEYATGFFADNFRLDPWPIPKVDWTGDPKSYWMQNTYKSYVPMASHYLGSTGYHPAFCYSNQSPSAAFYTALGMADLTSWRYAQLDTFHGTIASAAANAIFSGSFGTSLAQS
jgi:hypothetical protein